MGRPPGYQWQPLGLDTDPVPGDPQALTTEAQHLASIAHTITGQIAAMHKIASDTTETGLHATKIRSTALSLAGSLQAVAGRYAKVSSALTAWIPELEQAQALSLRALNEAELPYAKLHQSVTLPSGSHLTAAQKQEIADHNQSMQRAQDQLDAAKALLTKAITLRDTEAARCAAKINQASNDSLIDHTSFLGSILGAAEGAFDDVERAVGHVAKALKDVCLVLEVVAAGLALVALACTGVGILLEAAFFLTGAALLLRTLLAVTGNGSWTDVITDAAALLTLGIGGGISGLGGLVGRAGKTIDGAVEIGDQLVGAERAASLSGRAAASISRFSDAMVSSRIVPNALAKPLTVLARNLNDFNEGMRPLVSGVVKEAEETSSWSRIFAGGEEPAKYAVQMRMLLSRFPDSPEIAQLGARFSQQLNWIRAVVGAGSAFAVVPPAASGFQYYDASGQQHQAWHFAPWEKLEDRLTIPPVTFRWGFERVASTVG